MLSGYKITADDRKKGVKSAPDRLTGTAAQNKAIFDNFPDGFADKYNQALDYLQTSEGAKNIGAVSSGTVQGHIDGRANPHGVTKAQVGLGSVDNTSDAAKPVSAAQQAALVLKADITYADGLAAGTLAASKAYADARDAQLKAGILAEGIYGVLYYDPFDGRKKPLQDILNALANFKIPGYTWRDWENKNLTWAQFEALEVDWNTFNGGGW